MTIFSENDTPRTEESITTNTNTSDGTPASSGCQLTTTTITTATSTTPTTTQSQPNKQGQPGVPQKRPNESSHPAGNKVFIST